MCISTAIFQALCTYSPKAVLEFLSGIRHIVEKSVHQFVIFCKINSIKNDVKMNIIEMIFCRNYVVIIIKFYFIICINGKKKNFLELIEIDNAILLI